MGMFNSKEFEYADVKVQILGAQLSGLRGLKYKKTVEKEHVYGAGSDPKSIQRGNKKYDGTLTVLKSDYDAMHRAAVAAGYEDLTDVPAKDIILTCVYENTPNAMLSTDTLVGVEFTETEDGMKQGDKFTEIALPFLFLKLKKA